MARRDFPDADEPAELSGAHPGGLTAWLGRLASDDAARTRSRLAWLQRQAAEEGTFAGVLADLAERGRPVAVHLHNGRRHRGVLTGLGQDFVVLVAGDRHEVLVRQAAISSLRTVPGEAETIGDRLVLTDATLHDALAALAEERVRVVITGAEPASVVAGTLRAVGVDVVTIRLDGDGGTAYLLLASVSDASVDESG